ncbi:MAG TPA: type VI secretion system baseplate subunit TssK [Polyangiaceae bacterium]|nr:type VI secretion system baseplate subunit TssK [Polyangiaceae bacterium]
MTMKLADKVAWSEGVLLRPQHFQQADRYHEAMMAARLDAIDALNWGALHIELDERALQQGVLALSVFEGVMPDGTPVLLDAQSGQAAPKQRPLEPHFPPAQAGVLVYLAVPHERSGVTNYTEDGDQLRYALRTRKVSDSARDDRHAEIQLALPNLVLLFGDESRDGFSALPIARVVRNESGSPVFSDSYVPPCLRIQCSSAIVRRLEHLLTGMIARFRVLRDARRITGENRVEFSAADVTRYLQLHALNGMLPSMFHLAHARDASPRAAFLLLSQLAGQLATFAPDGDMTTPIDFDYGDLEASLGAVFDLCERLLCALDTERYVACRLELQNNGRFYADLSDVRLDGCSRFLIGVDSKHARALVVQEIAQRAKLASHGDIDFVLSRNISGIRVNLCERPPGELPTRPGLTYFTLPLPDDDVYWKHVRKDRNLVVWLPPGLDAEQCTVSLFGLLDS